jgi:hypothetical protein
METLKNSPKTPLWPPIQGVGEVSKSAKLLARIGTPFGLANSEVVESYDIS